MTTFIEHVALNVADPAAIAQWYCTHLGMTILRGADTPTPVRFLGDPANGKVILEFYHNETIPISDFATISQVTFHIAFHTDDVEAMRLKLLNAGATALSPTEILDGGMEVAFVRDPWGLCVQIIHRNKALL
ncbi:VOC family protein [Candidatus Sumerlaeota bacterium]|nr:VOC family protein [Candidatus Sumerlaeota bacterium]